MNETIQIAIISGGLAALINCIFQASSMLFGYITRKLDERKLEEKEFKSKKEEIYLAAIDRLLQIRRGFDITQETARESEKIQDMVEKNNEKYFELAPKLRLYASDEIFEEFQELAYHAVYAFASQYERRLFEDSKYGYTNRITLLARKMQEDIGVRKYNKNLFSKKPRKTRKNKTEHKQTDTIS